MDAFNQPVIRELLDDYPLAHLDAGKPRESIRSRLQALTIESLFEPREVKDRAMAACCLSAIWLWHNYLEESHKISQEIETSAGSAWHGIMHRREGDFWNANYWFARVRDASLFPQFAVAKDFLSQTVDNRPGATKLGKMPITGDWRPSEFTHEVERVLKEDSIPELETALQLATAEWRVQFRSCWLGAIGGNGKPL